MMSVVVCSAPCCCAIEGEVKDRRVKPNNTVDVATIVATLADINLFITVIFK